MIKTTIQRAALALVALTVATLPAAAHVGPEAHGSFMSGLTHPLFGLDHILAMVAVGLWAATLGGRAIWMVPAAFVGTMAIGFTLPLLGVSLPLVEPAILASVVVLGLFVAAAVRVPTGAGMALVAAFAMFHGFAHGAELGAANGVGFAGGFIVSTIALHAVGVAIGLAALASPLRGRVGPGFLRLAGAGTAVAGLALVVG